MATVDSSGLPATPAPPVVDKPPTRHGSLSGHIVRMVPFHPGRGLDGNSLFVLEAGERGAGALLRTLVCDAALSGCGCASFDDLTWPPPSTSVSGMPLSLHCATR